MTDKTSERDECLHCLLSDAVLANVQAHSPMSCAGDIIAALAMVVADWVNAAPIDVRAKLHERAATIFTDRVIARLQEQSPSIPAGAVH